MCSAPDEEQIIKTTIELLSLLVNSVGENHDGKDHYKNDFDHQLSSRLSSPSFSNAYINLLQYTTVPETPMWPIHNPERLSRWKFIRTCVQLMKIIRDIYGQSSNEKVKLLSIAQKKVLEAAIEFVVSLGILHNLLPGVGVSLECRSKNVHKLTSENLSDFAKYRRLCQVVDDLYYLFDVEVFHDLIVSKHLEDVLAAIFQLSFAPLKKPSDNKHDCSVDFETVDDDFELKDISYSTWKKFETDKKKYVTYLTCLSEKIYKPLLVRKFSLLLNSKKIPRWMKQKLTEYLSAILRRENGVAVTITALTDVESTTPTLSTCCASVAKLISHECQNDASSIVPQFLKIMQNQLKQPRDCVFIEVVIIAVNYILSENPTFAETRIFEEIRKPLKFLEFSTEEEIRNALYQLYNLCALSSNDALTVPVSCVMLPICRILFHLHCQIKDGVCYLKSCVRELMKKFLLELHEPQFSSVMNSFIFNAEASGILSMPSSKCFSLSPSGGVRLVDGKNDSLEIEFSAALLDLVKNIPENEQLIRALFIYLLKAFVSENQNEEFAQRRFVIVVLLTELSQDPATLRHILKDSENIIEFVGQLLRTTTETTGPDDIVCVCLTFLTMVLYDMKKKKDVRWDIFNSLTSVVDKLTLHSTPEVKFLAEEVRNLIRSRGLIGNVDSTDRPKKSLGDTAHRSECERRIEEACDPLLPVRAHALMELISSLKRGDAEALVKKEKIYCLFQENMKDQDSFLYLRAIEGLSCMATLKPNDVLPLLCQEYLTCSFPVTQLKIGEVLVRTTKLLNDFVHSHKKLLVCTFMSGVKNENSLIRASSLSNLAEICLVLERGVEDVLYEVLTCAVNVAQHDSDVEPRRAAVLLVCGLFRGLKTFIFTVLESHLADLYRTLKRLHATDQDEVVRVQIAEALKVLDDNTRQFLFPKPSFQRKIHVLHPL